MRASWARSSFWSATSWVFWSRRRSRSYDVWVACVPTSKYAMTSTSRPAAAAYTRPKETSPSRSAAALLATVASSGQAARRLRAACPMRVAPCRRRVVCIRVVTKSSFHLRALPSRGEGRGGGSQPHRRPQPRGAAAGVGGQLLRGGAEGLAGQGPERGPVVARAHRLPWRADAVPGLLREEALDHRVLQR